MNPFQLAGYRRMVHEALHNLGANDCVLKRQPKDANGQPTGSPAVIGTLYGIDYRKGYSSAGIRIDLPGVVATDSSRRFVAVASEIVIPQEADLITINGREVAIIRVDIPPGIIIFDLLLMD